MSSPETHKHIASTTAIYCISIDAVSMNYLSSCMNGSRGFSEGVCCSHYALCMCGLSGNFSGLRWTMRREAQTCSLAGVASMLSPSGEPLDVGSGQLVLSVATVAVNHVANELLLYCSSSWSLGELRGHINLHRVDSQQLWIRRSWLHGSELRAISERSREIKAQMNSFSLLIHFRFL